MNAKIEINEAIYEVDFSQGLDLSMEMQLDSAYNVNAYYAPFPSTQPFKMHDFVGLIKNGSPVNYRHIFFSPHGNGTHTECLSHILDIDLSVNQCFQNPYTLAYLTSVYPTLLENGDRVILFTSLVDELEKAQRLGCTSFVIRTLPNDPSKTKLQYSGTNPPYIEAQIAEYLCAHDFQNLLIDLPSLDREMDEGKLAAHRAFWQVPTYQNRLHASITELIHVRDDIKDGQYLMHLQVANMKHDALPSRPMLYKIIGKQERQ